jgi:hypothetical protein
MKRNPSAEYLEKAKLLTKEETERLMSRMRARLMCKMQDEKLGTLECVAIQLEVEDEQLKEWRAKTAEMRENEKTKAI